MNDCLGNDCRGNYIIASAMIVKAEVVWERIQAKNRLADMRCWRAKFAPMSLAKAGCSSMISESGKRKYS